MSRAGDLLRSLRQNVEAAAARRDAGLIKPVKISQGRQPDSRLGSHDDLTLLNDRPAPTRTFRLPTSPTPGRAARPHGATAHEPKWYPPGTPVTVAGVALPDGMVYVGQVLTDALSSGVTSFSINDQVTATIGVPEVGAKVGYYPSYSRLTPSQRGTYLQWLASGRTWDMGDQWCLFLFLYGLERRILSDVDPTTSHDEIAEIYKEVDRLLHRFAHRHAFLHYARSFLDLLDALLLALGVAPPERLAEDDLLGRNMASVMTNLELAAAARHDMPVSAEVFLTLLRTQFHFRLRVPARRCVVEFDALFLERFTSRFGDGLRLPAKTDEPFVVGYYPALRGVAVRSFLLRRSALGATTRGGQLLLEVHAGSSWNPQVTLTIADLSPVNVNEALPEEFFTLVRECEEALSRYSRYLVSKDADPTSYKARALLPAELRRPAPASTQVNLDVVADLLAADQVTDILTNRLTDDEVAEVPDVLVIFAEDADDYELGLDDAHWALASELSSKPSWRKFEAMKVANDLGIDLLGLAITHINRLALERTGVVLLEGSDPIEVDQQVFEEMTQ
jgi:hypothetical protein